MTEMVYGAMPARVYEPVLPRWWRTIDKWTLAAVFVLFGLGLLLGLAASVPLAERNGLDPYTYVNRQAFFGGFGMVLMLLISMANPDQIRRLGVLGFVCALAALVVLPVVGDNLGKGAVRWINLGFVTVQPSEFLKPGLMVVTGWLIAASFDLNGPPGKLISFGLAAFSATFLAFQPDFGQALLVMFGWGVIYFVAGARMTLIIAIVGLVTVAGYTAYHNSEHFARRINGYMAADVDPRSQVGYAANAIQEGGIFGVGIGEGQVKMILPDAHTDFIIAVAAEEYGLFMVMLIIGIYGFIVIRALWRLMGERDPFIRLAGTGLASVLGIQAMVNMGVAVRLLPAKGMTLPFISYGGSSIVAAAVTAGMLLALTRARPQGQISDIFKRGR